MIHSGTFYRSFDIGFMSSAPANAVSRVKGGVRKYTFRTGAGTVRVWFRVNPKASGNPCNPGEFWPELIAPDHVRHASRMDDGAISWYQYVSQPHIAVIQELRRKVASRSTLSVPDVPDASRDLVELGSGVGELVVDQAPEPRLPHSPLFYMNAEDAEEWGRLFGTQVSHWVQAFTADPETLVQYMSRVHWAEE